MRLTLTLLLMLLTQIFLSAETNAQTQTPACTTITVRDAMGDSEGAFVCAGNTTFTANVTGIVPADKPTFKWTISTGRIVSGHGTSAITVDLGDSFGAEVTAEVEVSGVSGLDEQCAKRASLKVKAGDCFCPNVEINCPTRMLEYGEPATIYLSLSGSSRINPRYSWQVSAGKITSGQGTPTITVDTTKLAGQNVTATVEVDGLPPGCKKVYSCSLIPIDSPPLARKFDEYRTVSWINEEKRLNNFAVQLRYEPGSQAHVIIYAPRRVSQRLARVRKFLIEKHGIDPERISLVNGGFNRKTKVELWIVPPGAGLPEANSNF